MESHPCLWIRRFNIVKVSVLSKLNYKFNLNSIKISAATFAETDKVVLKFT